MLKLAVFVSIITVASLLVFFFRKQFTSSDPDRELEANYTNRMLSRYK